MNSFLHLCTKIVNLTPHLFNLIDKNDKVILELPACETPARASEQREQIDMITYDISYQRKKMDAHDDENYVTMDIPVNKVIYGNVENLPAPEKDTIYIVSRIVAEACPNRNDLYIPNNLVRDEKGRIIGCRALTQIN